MTNDAEMKSHSPRWSGVRFVLHIGAGKTGSSSVQSTLSRNKSLLEAGGVRYLGMNLEHAPEIFYDWQQIGLSEKLFSQSQQDIDRQLVQVLAVAIDKAVADGMHTLVWSNEAYVDVNQRLRPAWQFLIDEGVGLELLLYLRNPLSWAKSGYMQWGIKHKTYTGVLLPFMKWYMLHDRSFLNKMISLEKSFGDALRVRNYDACGDVVEDFFLRVLGFVEYSSISKMRANDSMPPEELLIRAIFNNRNPGIALPSKLNDDFRLKAFSGLSADGFLAKYLPSATDLEDLAKIQEPDLIGLNALLVSRGQPELKIVADGGESAKVDSGRLMIAMLELIVGLSERLSEVERNLSISMMRQNE